MATGSGTDAVAAINNPTSSVGETVGDAQTAMPTAVFKRAVVTEVLYDLSWYSEEEWEELAALVSAPDQLKIAPRNSIIARIITGGGDGRQPDAEEPIPEGEEPPPNEQPEPAEDGEDAGEQGTVGLLCYPFFPPHLCFPVKPGEQVWVVQDSPDIPTSVAYWVCRIPEPNHIDDINYTHSDRKLVGSLEDLTASQQAEASNEFPMSQMATQDAPPDITDFTFGFPNGPDQQFSPDTFTLKEEFGYENIVVSAGASYQFTPEAVPRFTKRPGDFVIQGSNNTLICLGTERGWTHPDVDTTQLSSIAGGTSDGAEYSNATMSQELYEKHLETGGYGAIDIVVGRGRYSNPFMGNGPLVDPELTACRTIENVPPSEEDGGRDPYVENNKNPTGVRPSPLSDNNRWDAPAEGDPDFEHDAARIYVSMSSNPDAAFFIGEPGTTMPSIFAEDGEDILDIEADNVTSQPSAIVLKSDELRIIARKQDSDLDPDHPGGASMNGSIRLIKEGVPDDDLAMISLLKDGTIQISGKRIFLGRTPDDGGRGGGTADGESTPFMRYDEFTQWADAFAESLQTALDSIVEKWSNYNEQVEGCFNSNASGGSQFFIGPNAPMGAVFASYASLLGAMRTGSVTNLTPKIQTAHDDCVAYQAIASERIFGE